MEKKHKDPPGYFCRRVPIMHVMTICSRTIGYCFPYCFLEIFNLIIPKQGIEMQNFFPEQILEILKKWAPPCHITFKSPRGASHDAS